eukprot:jgi/Chrzof1/9948/Cz04g21220.t1
MRPMLGYHRPQLTGIPCLGRFEVVSLFIWQGFGKVTRVTPLNVTRRHKPVSNLFNSEGTRPTYKVYNAGHVVLTDGPKWQTPKVPLIRISSTFTTMADPFQQVLFPDMNFDSCLGPEDDLTDLISPDFFKLLEEDEVIPDAAPYTDGSDSSNAPLMGFAAGSPEVTSSMQPAQLVSAASASHSGAPWHAAVVTTSMVAGTSGHLMPVSSPSSSHTDAVVPSSSCGFEAGSAQLNTHLVKTTLKVQPKVERASSVSTSTDTSDCPSQSDPCQHLTKQQIAANKRRAPEVDWRSIEDPAERRKQRRLAKNRVTAARSRERKKSQWGEMEQRMNNLEAENSELKSLLETLAKENAGLKSHLASLTRGAGGTGTRSSPEPAALECLAIMHLVCLLLCVRLFSVALQVSLALCPLLGLHFSWSSLQFGGLHPVPLVEHHGLSRHAHLCGLHNKCLKTGNGESEVGTGLCPWDMLHCLHVVQSTAFSLQTHGVASAVAAAA